ncbi:MAG: hypothetical protein EBR82_68800, partial [Caulobacteraceae bacterium]|nr:hypothetical protein [Caulobacteraceae bacterium]
MHKITITGKAIWTAYDMNITIFVGIVRRRQAVGNPRFAHWSWGRGMERAAPVGQAYNSAFAS